MDIFYIISLIEINYIYYMFNVYRIYYYKNKEDLQKLKKLDSLLNTVAKKFNNHKINIQPLVKKSIENF